MHDWLLDHLCCPACKASPLHASATVEAQGQVIEGTLSCRRCPAQYPVRKGIPRFVDSDRYVDSFSFQRRAVRKHWDYYTNEDSAERLFADLTPIPIEQYRQGALLDAGCGYGRWVRFFSERGVRVIGVDLSTDSIELCASQYASRENVGLVQADIFDLPFPPGHFDNIFSFGVLHHTPDTRAALERLASLLKPGGNISIYVYPRFPMVELYRRLTTRLPVRVVYTLSVLHNYLLMSWLRHIKPLNAIYSRFVKTQSAPLAWQRIHADLDQFTSRYAHRTTYPVVYNWFRDLGLEDIRLTNIQISITARKPGETSGNGARTEVSAAVARAS